MVSNDKIGRQFAEEEMSPLTENTETRSKIIFCPNCGIKNNNPSNFCSNCGTELTNFNKKIDHSTSDDSLSNAWLLVGALFLIIGVIGGLYYAFKGKKGAWALVLISIIFWVVWAIVFSSI